MQEILKNPWRGRGLDLGCPMPSTDAGAVARLLTRCPVHAETPLHAMPALAARAGVAAVHVKDERTRMGLGSFKALGAAYAIARDAADAVAGTSDRSGLETALAGRTYVAASAGNHGLSVAVGARLFGASSRIYLAETVPAGFATRLEAKGARVVREGADYEASMEAAARAALREGWTLLSDSSWPGYVDLPMRVMEGYLQLAAEVTDRIDAPPSHILLQAGVGGLAAAVAAHARVTWGDAPQIIVVEPAAAPALLEGIRAGRVVDTQGPVSAMGRLDCKTTSMIALQGLARDADLFVTISEEEAAQGAAVLAEFGLRTTQSGGAGLAALLAGFDPGSQARVLGIVSEAAEDGEG